MKKIISQIESQTEPFFGFEALSRTKEGRKASRLSSVGR